LYIVTTGSNNMEIKIMSVEICICYFFNKNKL